MQVTEFCCNCGIEFTMPADRQAALQRTHATFYCPNGHGQHYTGKSADKKRIEQLERLLESHREDSNLHFAHGQDALGALKSCPLRCGWRSRKIAQTFKDGDAWERGLFRIQADVIDHLAREHGMDLPAETRGWLSEVAR